MALSSSRVSFNSLFVPIFTSLVFIPTYVNTRIEFSEGTLILKLPSKSVTAPTLALPFTFTVAPIRGSPVPSTRLPLTWIFCA
ncbi:Uncharacterised protein [Segatella copri]|nr:Uncharacterised protein [Segatella copri]